MVSEVSNLAKSLVWTLNPHRVAGSSAVRRGTRDRDEKNTG